MDVTIQPDLVYATHDGEDLGADLYRPAAPGLRAGVVLLPGGAGTIGHRSMYSSWGRLLAEHGYVAFIASCRLATPARATWQASVVDAAYAVQYLRGRAAELGVDAQRIAVMGGSAGGTLAALVALAGRHPVFASPHVEDPFHNVSRAVRAAITIYGPSDLIAQWEHSTAAATPLLSSLEQWLGGSVMDDVRERYYQMSPLYHATRENAAGGRWLVLHGTADQVVPPQQSEELSKALRRAGAVVRSEPLLGAPHGFLWHGAADEPGSWNAIAAPRILRFLDGHLKPQPRARRVPAPARAAAAGR